jgi:hypothetical protein
MHDASAVARFYYRNHIKANGFLWIVCLKKPGGRLYNPSLFPFVYRAFRVTVAYGFPGFYFHRNEAAARISGYEVNFSIARAEVAMQYLVMQLSEKNFRRCFAALTQIVLVHAAINWIWKD